jgi:hypothetical protein
MSKAAEQRRKEEMLRAEKAYLMDGMADDINSVANGDKYAQESKVFLQYYKELRTRGYVQSELNKYGSDLLNGRLTDEQGNPLLVDNIDAFNQLADQKVQELVGSISDPLVIDVVSPAIREWRHNTGVSFNSQLNKKLQTDLERSYIEVVDSTADKLNELGIEGVAQVLSQEADERYALTRDGKSTEKVVDQLLARMELTGDFRFGDIALRLKQGGNDLSSTQLNRIVDAKEALEDQIDASAKARAAAEDAITTENRRNIVNSVLGQITSPENMGQDPRAVIKQFEADYLANKGNIKDLYSLLGLATQYREFKTPQQQISKVQLQTEILSFANSSNQSETPYEFALRQIMASPGLVHLSDIESVLSFAQSTEQSSSLLANPEVSDFRKRAVETTMGTIAYTQALNKVEAQERFEIETEFDRRFQERYAEVFRESGTVTASEIRQIGQQVTQELIEADAQRDTLQAQQQKASDLSISGVTYTNSFNFEYSIDDVDDIVPRYSPSVSQRVQQINQARSQDENAPSVPPMTEDQFLFDIFVNEVLSDPQGIHEKSGLPKWQAFESRAFPGAYAYYYARSRNR